jgi:hypothetical protein
MPVITYDRFEGGLDLRPAAALSRSNALRVLRNAYVTTGRSIKKRPCLEQVYTLEPGTVGLKASGGRLRTFTGAATVMHLNPLFQPTKVPHITTGVAPTKIHYCDHFNALPYVVAEYGDGTSRHHYLDDPGAWVALTDYSVGDIRRPTTENGFRYEVTTDAGVAGAAEPIWPTVVGATVLDGGITWTCRTFAVTDANCPHSKQVTKRQQKIYAANGADVNYCATGDARDWSSSGDAGFLPAGLQAPGSDQVTGLGQYQNNLAVTFSDSIQVWAVSSDPAQNDLTGTIENIGTIHHLSMHALAGDLFLLSQSGFRSISLLQITENLQDADVGNPIDKLVVAAIASFELPRSIYFPKLGQWWCINGTKAYVYSFSKTAKLSAWSEYEFPFSIDDATVLNQELYLRSGDNVYKVSSEVFADAGNSIPLVDVTMFYQDGGKPGVLKQFTGIRAICTGRPTVSFLFAAENQALESDPYELDAVSVPGQLDPVEICSERIAPHFTHQKNEDFELSQASIVYEPLGVV